MKNRPTYIFYDILYIWVQILQNKLYFVTVRKKLITSSS